MNLSQTLASISVPWDSKEENGDPKIIWYRDKTSGTNDPGLPVSLEFTKVAYISKAAESFGQVLEGVSIVIHGYPIQTDVEGKPVTEETETGVVYKLIDKDSEEKQKDPQVLMIWRLRFARDWNRGRNQQPKGVPLLSLIPYDGVPLKDSKKTSESGEETTEETNDYSRKNVDWNINNGLQKFLEGPLMAGSAMAKQKTEAERSEEDNLWIEIEEAIPVIVPQEAEKPGFTQRATGTALKDAISEAIPDADKNPFENQD